MQRPRAFDQAKPRSSEEVVRFAEASTRASLVGRLAACANTAAVKKTAAWVAEWPRQVPVKDRTGRCLVAD